MIVNRDDVCRYWGRDAVVWEENGTLNAVGLDKGCGRGVLFDTPATATAALPHLPKHLQKIVAVELDNEIEGLSAIMTKVVARRYMNDPSNEPTVQECLKTLNMKNVLEMACLVPPTPLKYSKRKDFSGDHDGVNGDWVWIQQICTKARTGEDNTADGCYHDEKQGNLVAYNQQLIEGRATGEGTRCKQLSSTSTANRPVTSTFRVKRIRRTAPLDLSWR